MLWDYIKYNIEELRVKKKGDLWCIVISWTK